MLSATVRPRPHIAACIGRFQRGILLGPKATGEPKDKTAAPPESEPHPKKRIAVDPNHGLWHFFRKKEVDGVVRYDTVEPPDRNVVTGRSWTAAELRLKSFSDLHTLWYVVLRERNLLATQKEEARRMGVPFPRNYNSFPKVLQCRKTMARIKCVLNERRLAYEGAVKLVSQKQEEAKAASPADENQLHTQNGRVHVL